MSDATRSRDGVQGDAHSPHIAANPHLPIEFDGPEGARLNGLKVPRPCVLRTDCRAILSPGAVGGTNVNVRAVPKALPVRDLAGPGLVVGRR